MAKAPEVCKEMLGMAIAWSACQLGVPHSTVLPDQKYKQGQDDLPEDRAEVLRSTVLPDWAM